MTAGDAGSPRATGASAVERNTLIRAGLTLADFTERWFPDAFVFALLMVVVTFGAGLAAGEKPLRLVEVFGSDFWSLVPFTMQMALVIVGGYVVASSPPAYRLIQLAARVPKSPRAAVAFVAFFSMASSLLSWGLSLVLTGLLVREICRRLPRVDYRAIGAAAYLGLGSIWAFGLSSSAALMMATKSAIPPALLPVTGILPLSQTIFLWQSVVSALVIMAASVAIAWFSCPSEKDAKTQADFGIDYKPLTVTVPAPVKPADRLEHAWPLSFTVGLLAVAYVGLQIARKGGLAALDLNLFNLAFLAVGLLLHARPISFLSAVASAVPATAGVLIQFPFYGGVFGLISHTVLAARLEHLFTSLSTPGSFPLLVAVYSAVLGVFVPSGGAKWVIEAPYVMAAANAFHVNLGWTVQIYNAAEALPNLLNPFWMLPLMGILSVRARELAGYAVLQLLFHVPLVLALCWLFARTLPYLPPHP